jgi:hypothetical protein
MPSVVQRRNPNRGRPRKVVPPRPPLVHTKRQWSHYTGDSMATTTRKIERGELHAMPSEGPGKPRKIFTTEYVRHGYVNSLDELPT